MEQHSTGDLVIPGRRKTKEIRIGNTVIGGANPIAIQSMTNTRTEDIAGTVSQIKRLEELGCEIIRCTVPNMEAAKALAEIKRQISIPLVADIHFDYKLAVASIENGADKIRINPGNIGGEDALKAVVSAAKERNIPIRVGVNSGSLEKEILERDGGVTATGLCESALEKVKRIEDLGYSNLVLSIKSSDVRMCIEAYRLASAACDYPMHIGITEAGTVKSGEIKSSAGLGVLLYLGIGDTIRISLTGDPGEEIIAAKKLLSCMGLRSMGAEVVSCPTCGRTKIDLISLADKVEELAAGIKAPIKIAVMGCAVNGPGEAREADFGIAGGDGEGLLFQKGKILRKVPEAELLSALKQELEGYL